MRPEITLLNYYYYYYEVQDRSVRENKKKIELKRKFE